MNEPTYFKACIVCTCLTANGEYDDGEDTAEKCIAGQERIWGEKARHFMLAGCPEDSHMSIDEDHECQDFEQGFSWSDCEGCGDPHGGDRYLLAVFDN